MLFRWREGRKIFNGIGKGAFGKRGGDSMRKIVSTVSLAVFLMGCLQPATVQVQAGVDTYMQPMQLVRNGEKEAREAEPSAFGPRL